MLATYVVQTLQERSARLSVLIDGLGPRPARTHVLAPRTLSGEIVGLEYPAYRNCFLRTFGVGSAELERQPQTLTAGKRRK